MLRIDVNRLLQNRVVLLGLGHLLDNAIGALVDLLKFFVLACVQIFLKFAALALEVAVLVDQRALARDALGFRQRGSFPLEFLGRTFQALALYRQVFLTLGKFCFQLGLGSLGRQRFAQDAIGVHEADTEVFRRRQR